MMAGLFKRGKGRTHLQNMTSLLISMVGVVYPIKIVYDAKSRNYHPLIYSFMICFSLCTVYQERGEEGLGMR